MTDERIAFVTMDVDRRGEPTAFAWSCVGRAGSGGWTAIASGLCGAHAAPETSDGIVVEATTDDGGIDRANTMWDLAALVDSGFRLVSDAAETILARYRADGWSHPPAVDSLPEAISGDPTQPTQGRAWERAAGMARRFLADVRR